jgi:hypothetical protein
MRKGAVMMAAPFFFGASIRQLAEIADRARVGASSLPVGREDGS